ncbi:MAG: hypothetical protein ACTHQQ_17600 [Solirubrobacteraceae bacterium]
MKLARGKHPSPQHGACVMELASMLAGERFSDRPRSVSPVIGAFLRGYNDLVDDHRRRDLIRYAAEAVGTAASEEVELARVKRLVQWADERWAQNPGPSVLGSLGLLWARRLPPTDPDSAGVYAIRSIHRGNGQVHRHVLALLDELIATGDQEPAQERQPAQRITPDSWSPARRLRAGSRSVP